MDAIEKMIDRYGPAAVCDALESLLTPERIARIDQVIDARLSSVAAAVEDTYDPHNAAATIRTCEALGLQQLYVIEPTGRFSAAKGVTRGSHRWLDLHSFAEARAAVDAMRAHGFRIYATLPDPAAQSIEDVSVEQPIAVVFGNEHDGVSRAVVEACDGAVTVPMFGFTESYNLSVTVGRAMSRLAARRRAYIGTLGDLSAERRARLRARWFALRIRAAVDIVDRKLAT